MNTKKFILAACIALTIVGQAKANYLTRVGNRLRTVATRISETLVPRNYCRQEYTLHEALPKPNNVNVLAKENYIDITPSEGASLETRHESPVINGLTKRSESASLESSVIDSFITHLKNRVSSNKNDGSSYKLIGWSKLQVKHSKTTRRPHEEDQSVVVFHSKHTDTVYNFRRLMALGGLATAFGTYKFFTKNNQTQQPTQPIASK